MSYILSKTPNKKQLFFIKVFIFFACLLPVIRLTWLGIHNNLTANPIEFVERSTGFWALFILLATLSLTPVRVISGRVWQLQLRRMLGLFMFFYACLHITTYMWLDYSFDWSAMVEDIIKHPYVLVGFTAFILTLPLAITSNNKMIKRLRERWKQLHQLVYVIAILGVVHFWWLVKKDISEPLLYAAILIILLGIRVFARVKSHALKRENKRSMKS